MPEAAATTAVLPSGSGPRTGPMSGRAGGERGEGRGSPFTVFAVEQKQLGASEAHKPGGSRDTTFTAPTQAAHQTAGALPRRGRCAGRDAVGGA